MTLQIEAGKYYRNRRGRKVGPMVVRWPHDSAGDIWGILKAKRMWNNDGREYGNRDGDLIAEWPAHIITHEGREYDLTALETPLGMLQEKAPPVAGALKAWPHGVEQYTSCGWRNHAMHKVSYHPCVVYRAKPAPVEVRVPCQRGLSAFLSEMEFGTCIKRADGSIDWTTWEA